MTRRSNVLMAVTAILICLIVLLAHEDGTQAQWGEIKAAQIEDVFLRNDGDDISSGGLSLGGSFYCGLDADISGNLSCEDDIVANGSVLMSGGSELHHPAGYTSYYSAAEIMDATLHTASGVLYAIPQHINAPMRVPIRIPQEDFGGDFVFDQVTVYALDQTAGATITRLSLESVNPASGAITTRAANDTDLGNGTSGSLSGNILSTDVGPLDEAFYLTIVTAGMTASHDMRVTGVKVDGHRN